MNKDFIAILQKIISEQGKETFLNVAKFKALLSDYTKGEYKKESRVLLLAYEAGTQKAIEETNELQLCKKQQISLLQEEFLIAEEAAKNVVNALALILKGDKTIASSVNNDAQKLYDRGEEHFKNNDYDNAIKCFDEAIKLDPNFADAFGVRGLCWHYKKDYDNAIKDYSEAIRLNPDYVEAFYFRGLCWGDKKDYDNAIKDSSEAIRLKPDNPDFFYLRGLCCYNKGDYKNALADFKNVLKTNPNFNDKEYVNQNIKDLEEKLNATAPAAPAAPVQTAAKAAPVQTPAAVSSSSVLSLPKGVIKITKDMLRLPANFMGHIIIPEGIQVIGQRCFENMAITGVTFPKSLRKIEEYAFKECKLNNLTIMGQSEDNMVEIDIYAFMGNSELTRITIGYCAFKESNDNNVLLDDCYYYPPFVGCPISQITLTNKCKLDDYILGIKGNVCYFRNFIKDNFSDIIENIYGNANGTYVLKSKYFKTNFPPEPKKDLEGCKKCFRYTNKTKRCYTISGKIEWEMI